MRRKESGRLGLTPCWPPGLTPSFIQGISVFHQTHTILNIVKVTFPWELTLKDPQYQVWGWGSTLPSSPPPSLPSLLLHSFFPPFFPPSPPFSSSFTPFPPSSLPPFLPSFPPSALMALHVRACAEGEAGRRRSRVTHHRTSPLSPYTATYGIPALPHT